MKKLLIVMLSFFLLISYQSIENNIKNEGISTDNTIPTDNAIFNSTNNIIDVKNIKDYSDCQNDLVYRDYGSGIKITHNSKLIINQLNLNLNDETADIYVVNLVTNNVFKLYDYQPNQNIFFTPNIDGVYKIIAVISDGEIIDLTPKAGIETTHTEENSGGFIPLQ